ncbi:hypothetical protein GALMADRAFT_593567 [Galerina marginata CBS 339.88]|uniref:Uncharacterized protein n=1 Tax=Galerina marginata (strain CBS 339.88) TaxID=685588 RepID=A0A067T1V2_GALM3|nr:hypothetical protein GALMADRAFT_593567 [Galerina marginata CBS 339.88]
MKEISNHSHGPPNTTRGEGTEHSHNNNNNQLGQRGHRTEERKVVLRWCYRERNQQNNRGGGQKERERESERDLHQETQGSTQSPKRRHKLKQSAEQVEPLLRLSSRLWRSTRAIRNTAQTSRMS